MARLFLLALAASLGGCDEATTGPRDLSVAVERDFAAPVAAEPDFAVGDLRVSYNDPPYTPGHIACGPLLSPPDGGWDAGCPWCCCTYPYCFCSDRDYPNVPVACSDCDGPEDCPSHVCCSGRCSADGTCAAPAQVTCKLPVDCPLTTPYCCVPVNHPGSCYASDISNSSVVCQAR
jgi:hypothetical protein